MPKNISAQDLSKEKNLCGGDKCEAAAAGTIKRVRITTSNASYIGVIRIQSVII